jgi:glycosyltransferase involved in cell wall biosynthesis
MRIAIASLHPRPLSGQIEELVGLTQALETRGHKVKVISAFPNEVLLSPDRLKLGDTHKWPFVEHPVRAARILARLVAASSQVDLIQLNLPTPAFSMLGDLLQTMVRVPVVVYFEAHLLSARDGLKREHLRAAPGFYLPRLVINNHFVARVALHRAAHYLVNSQYQKEELIELGVPAKKITRLPVLIPRDKLVPVPRSMLRQRLNLPEGRLVTYIGHYNHVKGVDVLVQAFQKLAARHEDLHLVLAWSGLGKDRRVEQLLSTMKLDGRVVRLGRVSVMDVLAASDAAVLPYRFTIGQAVFPAALIEAMAAHLPVVTSDLPVLRELTEDGQTALLTPPNDPEKLAGAIERVLTEPVLVDQMLAAQECWMIRMRPQRVVKVYERVYHHTIAEQARVLQPARDRVQP